MAAPHFPMAANHSNLLNIIMSGEIKISAMWIKEKQCGINITEHVLQLQRVITWYRNVRYREVSLYELSLLSLVGRD